MSKWDGLNRRQFPRVKYPCLVVIHNSEESTDVLLTHTENVGVGGICVIFKQDIKLFCPVDIELDLMDFQDHIQCKGKVVWNVQRKVDETSKPLFYDIGIEFDNISEEDRLRIESIVTHLLKDNDREVPYS